MSKSLLDLMPDEEREKAIERGKRRIASHRARKGTDVSPEMYLVSEFGYYFTWEAVLAIRRGYTVVPKTDEDLDADRKAGRKPEWTSKYKKEAFTLDEALVLLEGARKVWYSRLVEQSHGNFVASNSARSNTPAQSFNNGMKPFSDRTGVEA